MARGTEPAAYMPLLQSPATLAHAPQQCSCHCIQPRPSWAHLRQPQSVQPAALRAHVLGTGFPLRVARCTGQALLWAVQSVPQLRQVCMPAQMQHSLRSVNEQHQWLKHEQHQWAATEAWGLQICMVPCAPSPFAQQSARQDRATAFALAHSGLSAGARMAPSSLHPWAHQLGLVPIPPTWPLSRHSCSYLGSASDYRPSLRSVLATPNSALRRRERAAARVWLVSAALFSIIFSSSRVKPSRQPHTGPNCNQLSTSTSLASSCCRCSGGTTCMDQWAVKRVCPSGGRKPAGAEPEAQDATGQRSTIPVWALTKCTARCTSSGRGNRRAASQLSPRNPSGKGPHLQAHLLPSSVMLENSSSCCFPKRQS